MSATDRAPGWYWVDAGDGEMQPARWEDDVRRRCWRLAGLSGPYQDRDLARVGPRCAPPGPPGGDVRNRALVALAAWAGDHRPDEVDYDAGLIDAIAAEFGWRPIATLAAETADGDAVVARTADGRTMVWRVGMLLAVMDKAPDNLAFPAVEWLRLPR